MQAPPHPSSSDGDHTVGSWALVLSPLNLSQDDLIHSSELRKSSTCCQLPNLSSLIQTFPLNFRLIYPTTSLACPLWVPTLTPLKIILHGLLRIVFNFKECHDYFKAKTTQYSTKRKLKITWKFYHRNNQLALIVQISLYTYVSRGEKDKNHFPETGIVFYVLVLNLNHYN